MTPVFEANRDILAEYKCSPNEKHPELLDGKCSKPQEDATSDSIHIATLADLDIEPSLEEFSKAIDSLTCGKTPDIDGIPPDLTKHCKSTLLQPLHGIICQCWRKGFLPQDMREAKIITLYKNRVTEATVTLTTGVSPF